MSGCPQHVRYWRSWTGPCSPVSLSFHPWTVVMTKGTNLHTSGQNESALPGGGVETSEGAESRATTPWSWDAGEVTSLGLRFPPRNQKWLERATRLGPDRTPFNKHISSQVEVKIRAEEWWKEWGGMMASLSFFRGLMAGSAFLWELNVDLPQLFISPCSEAWFTQFKDIVYFIFMYRGKR